MVTQLHFELKIRKVILLNYPTHGCLNSLLTTAIELVKRGEQVEQEMIGQKVEEMGIGKKSRIKRLTATRLFEESEAIIKKY